MKKIIFALASTVSLLTASGLCKAEEQNQPPAIDYNHSGPTYPPVLFVTNIENNDFETKLASYQAFEKLDTKAVGLPIGIRVLKGHRTKQNGTQFSTLMLSASTLGIIPVVSNTEFKVHYDIFVQGKSIATFKYQVDSTDVDNFWTAPYSERETKPSEEIFIERTLPQFLTELKENKDVQAVFNEYWEYFGDD